MYVPDHFEATRDDVTALLNEPGAVDLITATKKGLLATTLPMVHDAERGTMRGHVARSNDQWRFEPTGEALIILRGPDAYIRPGWYPSTTEHGRVVPTWNYLTVHVHGPLRIHHDQQWLAAHVRELTELHEADDAPWTVDDPPAGFVEKLLGAIIGIEVTITRIEAKAKYSQNRPESDIDGVARGLTHEGDLASARAVEAHRPPRRSGPSADGLPTVNEN